MWDMRRIIVTGSMGFDSIMDFPGTFEEHIKPKYLKILSVSFLAQRLNKNFGGVAGNIAYNFGLLGVRASIFASVGNDFEGEYESHLRKVGVDTSLIRRVRHDHTGSFFVITDKNNCQISSFYPGAMFQDEKLKLRKVVKKKEHVFVVVAPTMPKAMVNFVRECKQLEVPFLYDPAQQIPRLTNEELREGIDGAEILIGNDYEISMISRRTGWRKKDLLKRVRVLVTTLGSLGSLVETSKERYEIGILKPRRVLDPTGAGDAYIAGFLHGYLQRLPFQKCGQIGARIATCAVEEYGTQQHFLRGH